MYVELNRKFLRKQKDQAIKAAETQELEEILLWEDLESKVETTDIDEDGNVHLSIDNELGCFYVSWKPDNDDLIGLITVVIKRMNKIKTLLETIK